MTTNGHILADLAAPLRAAGLTELNVSIDTVDPARFRAVTRRGDLSRVLAGIDAASAAGLGVKLNAVALRGVNDDEIADLCAFAWDRGLVMRFIEHMPMSDGALYAPEREVGAAAIRRGGRRGLRPARALAHKHRPARPGALLAPRLGPAARGRHHLGDDRALLRRLQPRAAVRHRRPPRLPRPRRRHLAARRDPRGWVR